MKFDGLGRRKSRVLIGDAFQGAEGKDLHPDRRDELDDGKEPERREQAAPEQVAHHA